MPPRSGGSGILLWRSAVASIGPVTAEAARAYQIHTTILPLHYTVPALVDAIVKHFEPQAT